MAAPTAIQQLRLEVHTADARLGRQLPERFSQLFHNQLLGVLTEELARFDQPGAAWQVAQLVLELPPLPAARLEQDLPERLREALRKALSELAAATSANAAATRAAADPLAFLRYFLLHGHLPWQAGSTAFELDAAVGQAIRHYPAAMYALLRELGRQERPRLRLTQQLTLPTLEQLLGFLEPVHAPEVRAYLRETLAAHRRRPLVPASEPALRQVVYELALADLLANRHTQFNRRAFIERQLHQLAAHYSLAFTELLHQLVAVLPAAGPAPLPATLPGIIHALYQQTQHLPAANPPHPATSQQAQDADFPASASTNAAPQPPKAAYAALLYYLRHSSLPPAWGQQLSQGTLFAQLEVVLAQGRSALLRLAAAAGLRPTATALRRHLPPAHWQKLVQTLAPGQARPLLALVEELVQQAAPAAAATYREALWQQALEYLLASPNATGTQPPLRQWLPRQVPLPAGRAPEPPASRSVFGGYPQLFRYLLSGLAVHSFSITWLRRELQRLPTRDSGLLISFLHQHLPTRPVLRHLAALADFSLLAKLLPGQLPRRPARVPSIYTALAELLGGPGPARQQLLREAYLRFHLRRQGGPQAPGPAAIQALLAAYHLPARALHTYLYRHARRPALASSPFFGWLLKSLAVAAGAAAGERPSSAPRPEAQFAPSFPASFLPAAWAFSPVEKKAIMLPTGLFAATLPAANLRALLPAGSSRPATTYQLARPATVQEAQEAVFRYLLATGRPAPPALLRPLLRWVVVRQPAELLALLRRSAAASPLWPRLAALADFALLRQLLQKAGKGHQLRPPGLSALAELAASQGNSSRVLLFLKHAWLLARYRPAAEASGAALWQLAARYGLPRQATATKLARLAHRWPGLAAAVFFTRLLAPPQAPNYAGQSPLPVFPQTRRGRQREVLGEFLASATPTNMPTDTAYPPTREAAAPARHDLLFQYLLHGQAPWWHPEPLPAAALSHLLHQAARQPRPLREFLAEHTRKADVRRHLAHLADFSLLHELLPPSGGRGQLVRPALAALDRSLRRPAGGSQARFRLFLQEAYVAFGAGGPPTGTDALAPVRQLAAASGLAWRGVLARTSNLLRQHPALAAEPFFAALLHATLRQPAPAWVRQAQQRVKPAFWPASAQGAAPHTAPPFLPAAEAAWQLLESYLQTGQAPPAAGLEAALAELLTPPHGALLPRLRAYLSLPLGRGRLAAILSTTHFFGLLRRLLPVAYGQLAAVARDWLRLLALGLVPAASNTRAQLWEAVLAVAMSSRPPVALPAALVLLLLRAPNARQAPAQTAQQLLRLIGQRRLRLRGPLAALLATLLLAPAKPAAAPASSSPAPAAPTSLRPKPQPSAPGPAETVYIGNAGLVLLWPFFTMLFDRVGYLEQRLLKDQAAADRAAHLLQFLVTGEAYFPEYQLVLNKLLCGVEQPRPLPSAAPLSPDEKTTSEGLLGAALSQWSVLKNTSIAGLRETFLQRPGKLEWHADRVTLTVETKTVDILLDQLPWSISLIKLPWMALPLYVTWR